MKLGSSGLTLREVQVYHKPAIELTPRKVSQWIKQLPMANLGESSKSTYRLLLELNQAVVDYDKRLKILNILEPVIRKLTSTLEKQFVNNRIALSDKQTKIAALVQAIQTELAIGYHTIIESLIGEDLKRSKKKVLTIALIMATKYHSLIMLRCHQLYAAIPKRIWRELYSIYQIARTHCVESEHISLKNWQGEHSVHSSFVQTLLLSVAGPYQLRQREISLLWELLAEIKDYVSLDTHSFSNKNYYVIELSSSTAPVHKSLYRLDETTSTLKLSTTSSFDKLKQMLAQIQGNTQNTTRKIMLIKHLMQCWNQGTHREFARTASHGSAIVSFGLGSMHYLLKQENAQQDDSDNKKNSGATLETMEGSLRGATLSVLVDEKQQANTNSIDYLSSSEGSSDVWGKLYQTEAQKEYEKARQAQAMGATTIRSREKIVKDNYKSQDVTLINMSPSGYCVEVNTEQLPNHAQTGEVLGILEENYGQNVWNIGVVRWVKRQPKSMQIQMGLQLLAPDAVPIEIQLRNSKSDTNEFQRALLLPALTGIGQPATLLTNPISFRLNSKVRVAEKDDVYDARLSKEISANSSYRQFHFEKIDSPLNNQTMTDKSHSFDPDDLDGIWDLL